MPYTIDRDLSAGGGALVDIVSHWEFNLFSGSKLADDFVPPVRLDLDVTIEGRRMPTLFMVPAFVAKKQFHQTLMATGVDNVDAYPAVITNPETGEEFHDYVFINVVGLVECADMEGSDYQEIGPDMNLVDRLTVRADRLPETHIFRLAEDELTIVVSDPLHDAIRAAGFDDVYFSLVEVR